MIGQITNIYIFQMPKIGQILIKSSFWTRVITIRDKNIQIGSYKSKTNTQSLPKQHNNFEKCPKTTFFTAKNSKNRQN